MDALFALLNTPLGVFFCQLAVMLAIFYTGLSAFRRNIADSRFPIRRLYLGLAVLLAYRLILALAALFAATIPAAAGLPHFIEHSLTIASYVTLVWLWAVPEPRRPADTATWLLTALVLAAAATGSGILIQTGAGFFSSSVLLGVIGLALLAAGTLLLVRLQPELWGYGAAMLLVLGIGEALGLAFSANETAVLSLLRLTQIAAYPILATLPDRIPLEAPEPEPAQPVVRPVPERKRFNLPASIFDNFMTLGVESDMLAICRQAAENISYALVADICLIVSRPTESDEIIIFCGFDQVLEQEIAGAQIEARHLPMVVSAIQKDTPLRLPASSASSDLKFLSSALRLPKSGHLLVAPIRTESQTGIGALVLLTPYSSRTWSREDQGYLAGAASGLARLFDRAQSAGQHEESLRALERELEELRAGENQAPTDTAVETDETLARAHMETLEEFTRRQHQLESEIASLRSENERLSEEHAEKNWEQTVQHLQAENIQLQLAVDELESDLKDLHTRSEGLRSAKQEALEFINRLSAENEQLKRDLSSMDPAAHIAAGNGNPTNVDPHTENELNEALREIARLQSIVGEAEIKILELQNLAATGEAVTQKWAHIINLAEDMRQPMSSILGYSDFLLAESVGLLGALQRKFLERVKSSTNRMSTMVEDLVHIAAAESGRLKLNLGAVDLNSVIDSAIASSSIQIREKDLSLRVNLPDDLPTIEGDREAIRLTIIHLLHNAVAASPRQGEITIEIVLKDDPEAGSLIEINVCDSGEGIQPEDIPAVFSTRTDTRERLIPGLGVSTSGLAVAKTLVEAHGGRIWAASQSEKGTTFSLMLPVSRDPAADLFRNPGD